MNIYSLDELESRDPPVNIRIVISAIITKPSETERKKKKSAKHSFEFMDYQDYQDPSMKIPSWMAIGRGKKQTLINTPSRSSSDDQASS